MRRRKKGRKKKGQHMTETVAVLFIFFVLVLFGIIFFYQFQKVQIKEKQNELLGARAIDTTLTTLFLPELQCSNREAEPEENCIDMTKARHGRELFMKNIDYYFSIFSFAKVSVVPVFPAGEEIVLYDKEKTKPDGSIDWTRKEPTFFVVTLRDEVVGQEPFYGYGYIKIEVYS